MQLEIEYPRQCESSEPPTFPLEGEWIHADDCDCGVCEFNRNILDLLNGGERRALTPEEAAARVRYYEARAEEERDLHHPEDDEDIEEYTTARAKAGLPVSGE